jgi:hypothetical protein
MDSWKVALPLPGWDQASVWGWDLPEGSLFAQLYRNGDDGGDEPRIWLTTLKGWPAITSPQTLAEWIANATGVSLPDVLLALAAQAPGQMAGHLREGARYLAAYPLS